MNMKSLLLTFAMVAAGLTVVNAQAAIIPSPVTANMPVKIEIQNACEIRTAPTELDFGVHGVLSDEIDSTSAISVTCTTGAKYNIGLDDGGGTSDIDERLMVLGGESVGYQIYREVGRTTVWGNTVPTNTVAGTGTGLEQSISYTAACRCRPHHRPVYTRTPFSSRSAINR